jgi:hypothetical protein
MHAGDVSPPHNVSRTLANHLGGSHTLRVNSCSRRSLLQF